MLTPEQLAKFEQLSIDTTVPVQALINMAVDNFFTLQQKRAWPGYLHSDKKR